MNNFRSIFAVRTLGCLSLGALVALGCSGAEQTGSAGENGTGESDIAKSSEALSNTTIDVISATYGERCGVSRGDATWSVAGQCDHRQNCPYTISEGTLGDPAHGCDKDFDVDYACGTVDTTSSGRVAQHVSQEANGKQMTLDCTQMGTTTGIITVTHATYGGNCGAPDNNVEWDVGPYCNGWGHCRYFVSEATLGDPAHGCDKDYKATYHCSSNPTVDIQASAAKEANGRTVSFDCP
jgi:hypothetical protein